MTTEYGNQGAGVRPAKFGHAVIRTNRLKQMVEWYSTVLGAEVIFGNDFIVFLTYDDEHHRIAFLSMPGMVERPERSTGLDHLAYSFKNIGELVATYERLRDLEIMPVHTVNHGMTTSMYYRDPDGTRVEFQVDNFDTPEECKAWFRSEVFAQNPYGIDFDPEELARRYHAGVPEAELRRYAVQP